MFDVVEMIEYIEQSSKDVTYTWRNAIKQSNVYCLLETFSPFLHKIELITRLARLEP